MTEVIWQLVQYKDYLLVSLFSNGLSALNDANIILEILQAFEVLLQFDSTYNLKGEQSIAYKLEIADGLDKMEQLQKHPNV